MKRFSLINVFVFLGFMIGFGQSGKVILVDGNVFTFKRLNGIVITDTVKKGKSDFITHFPTVFNGEVREIQFDKLKSITFTQNGSAINALGESKTNIQFPCSALIEEISLLIDDVLTNELIVRNFDIGNRHKGSKDPEISKIIFD